jgi:hypothetical protein
MTQCSLVEVQWCLGGIYCFQLPAGSMQQARTLHTECYENLKSNMVILYGQVTLCNVHLLLTHCWLVLVFALKTDVAYFYQITLCHIAEDSTLQTLICMTNIKDLVLLISVLYVPNENPRRKHLFCKKHIHHDMN